ncbi:preprotein translocase subunit SecD [Pusillimonas sp. ANT_WB101]|uniref:SecDF P1 head subdomain-containing protein n=1 Tax=Pusillimonas sp. ANT_WB101 TaxID=2597356 RepID=UPI0011EF655D|nr:preprotein translocase subunit SecD [Pusillimonas sp. ANT_WB101]KAA0890597.1 preprotein translocase subunit SecD [Pusillimonas sp. ANT_WB101]
MKRTLFFPALIATAVLLAGCETTAPAQKAAAANNATVAAAQPAASQQAQATQVFFRLAQTESAEGLSELQLSDGSLWVLPQPVLSRADLASVEPLQTKQGQALVRFGFNQEGARKLSELSRRYQGKLMVVTIADNLVAVPRISEPLTQGAMVVSVASSEQAMAIARAVAGPGSNTQ